MTNIDGWPQPDRAVPPGYPTPLPLPSAPRTWPVPPVPAPPPPGRSAWVDLPPPATPLADATAPAAARRRVRWLPVAALLAVALAVTSTIAVRSSTQLGHERAAHRQLDSQVAADHAVLAANDARLVTARAAIADGVDKLATAKADNATLDGKVQDLTGKLHDLQGSLDRANTQVSTAQRERDSAREQVVEANCRLINLGFQLLGVAEFRKGLTATQIDQITRTHTICVAAGHGGDLTNGSVGA